MAIYDVNGNIIGSAYGVDSSLLQTVYDVEGNVISEDESPYPITNVVSYFRQETTSVANAVNALSDDWESFAFITDPHGSGNEQHSQAIALYLLANTKVSKIVLNGDYSVGNWSKTQYDTYVSPFLESDYLDDIYVVIGNHETYGSGATAESKASIYADFLQSKSNIELNQTGMYYSLDDAVRKIRYLFLNTSDSSETTMTQDQVTWITTKATLPSSEWSLVVIGHVNISNMGFTTMNETNGSAIISAINSCNGNIVGYFCGHQHIDEVYDTGSFYQTMLYCDKLETTNWYQGYSITNRSAGNTTEQAVSVISINTKTKDVVIRRIGVGRNSTLTYSYA